MLPRFYLYLERGGPEPKALCLGLKQSVYRLGRNVGSDVVVLDQACPPFLGQIRRIGTCYHLFDVNGKEQVFLQCGLLTVKLIRDKRHRSWIFALMISLGLFVLRFAEIVENEKSNPAQVQLPARGYFKSQAQDSQRYLSFGFVVEEAKAYELHFSARELGKQGITVKINDHKVAHINAAQELALSEFVRSLNKKQIKVGSNSIDFVGLDLGQPWSIGDVYLLPIKSYAKKAVPEFGIMLEEVERLLGQQPLNGKKVLVLLKSAQELHEKIQNQTPEPLLQARLDQLTQKLINIRMQYTQDSFVIVERLLQLENVPEALEQLMDLRSLYADGNNAERVRIEKYLSWVKERL